jgi:hypothetical protein
MNATMVASRTKAVPPPVVSSIQDIPLAKIRESKTNPRRFFDEAKLAALADNNDQARAITRSRVCPASSGSVLIWIFHCLIHRNRMSKPQRW